MNPSLDHGRGTDREIGAPRGEQQYVAGPAQVGDVTTQEIDPLRSYVGAISHDVHALRAEVRALRIGIDELLRQIRPAEAPPPQPASPQPAPGSASALEPGSASASAPGSRIARSTEAVYLLAGCAVAAVAVLIAVYLFTGT